MGKEDVELHLPPDVQYVGLARLVVCAAARKAGMSGERVEDLRMALSEATTNAVIAHQRADVKQAVIITFGLTDEGSFGVVISDTGPGFEPLEPEVLRNREWSLEGGLGVTVIRGLADDVRFVKGEGMRVHMQFSVGLEDPTESVAPADDAGVA